MIRKFKIVNAGNFLDFLEFSLFSSLLPLISRDLIEGNNATEKTSLAYLLFYIGFLGRPLGSLIFGFLGDYLGRRKALTFSLMGMSCSTFLLALIPQCSYAHLLIVVLRFIQGIFTGGEYSNATVYVLETDSVKNRFKNIANLIASGVFGASIGQFIGTIISSEIISFLSWRLVFIVISSVSLYVALKRASNIQDSMITAEKRVDYATIKEFLFSRYILMGIIFGCIINGLFYLIYTFVGTYSSMMKDTFVVGAYLISLLSTFMMGVFLLFWSRLSLLEKYSSSQFLKLSLVVMISVLYPLYAEISEGRITVYSIFLLTIFVAFMQLFALVVIKTIPENLPKHCRVLLSGLSESIGASFIGGASPFISSKMIIITGHQNAPAFYFIGLMLIAFWVVNTWPPRAIVPVE